MFFACTHHYARSETFAVTVTCAGGTVISEVTTSDGRILKILMSCWAEYDTDISFLTGNLNPNSESDFRFDKKYLRRNSGY